MARDKLITNVVKDTNIPEYKLIGNASIPVSQVEGKRWQKLVDDAIQGNQGEYTKWDNAFLRYRECGNESLESSDGSYKYHAIKDADENLVRQNVKILMRTVYTNNPSLAFNVDEDSDKPLAKLLEKALMFIQNRKTLPGVNLRSHVRRQILHAHLTNHGIIKLEYQAKKGSRQEAIASMKELQKKISEPKDDTDLNAIYQEMVLLQEELPALEEHGMMLTNKLPTMVVFDPNTTNADLSDCDWAAEEIWLDDDYITQKYLDVNEDGAVIRKSDGRITTSKSFNQTSEQETKQTIATRVMAQDAGGINNQEIQGKTKCYYIYDKITRMTKLFDSNDWTYPLWVWDDELQLTRYFPFFLLSFGEGLDGIVQPGEVSYYIGQANNINKRNRKYEEIVNSVFGTLIFNTRTTDSDTAKKLLGMLKSPDKSEAIGIKWDENQKLENVLQVFAPPSINYQQLFDKRDLYGSIDKSAGISEALRGGEFRTNTTTEAVTFYQQTQNALTNDQADQIEDVIEQISASMSEVLISKYTKDDMVALVGETIADAFTPMSVIEFNRKFSIIIAAGSTEKPTSESRKREAIQLVQMLGQFGQATPKTSMTISLKLLSNAFTNMNISEEDWNSLQEEAQAFLTKGVSIPQDQQQQQQQQQTLPQGQ